MADVYQFAQSSLELLERCVGAASNPGTKWIDLFKTDTPEVAVKQENVSVDSFSEENTIIASSLSFIELDSDEQPEQSESVTENDPLDRIAAILEAEPSNKIKFLEQSYNEHFLPALAEKLTVPCLGIICEDLLENQNFHEEILKHLIQSYIKNETPSVALTLLLRAYKTYPTRVLALIEYCFMRSDTSGKLLEEFLIAIDRPARSQLLQTISMRELPTGVFIHHINFINQLYKGSNKTNEIQNFLLNELLKSSQICREDKNYGRCLLTFFQGLKENGKVSKESLERLLRPHETSFKRPCQSIMSDLYDVQD